MATECLAHKVRYFCALVFALLTSRLSFFIRLSANIVRYNARVLEQGPLEETHF